MSNLRKLLDFHGIQPKKSLGQNFLHDPNTIAKIADIARIEPQMTVLEIGSGTGALTHYLVERAARVISCEVDERLMPLLRAEFAAYPNLELRLQDILEMDIPGVVGDEPYQVVGNLPYYITSAILRKILETNPKPKRISFMVQREVADRIIAKPNDMGLLTVSVQFYGEPKLAMKVSPNVFFPRPDVGSAVIHMEIDPEPRYDVPNEETFFKVVKAGFSQKRKQIKNSLANGLGIANEDAIKLLDHASLDPQRRGETFTLEEWAALSRAYASS